MWCTTCGSTIFSIGLSSPYISLASWINLQHARTYERTWQALSRVSTFEKYAVACIRESNHSRSSWTLQLFATNGFIFIYLVLSLIFTLIASQVCMSYILLHCFRAFLFSESSCVEAKFSRAILIEVCFKLHAAWSGAQSQGTFRSEVNKRTEATPSSTWSTGTKRTLTVMTLSARKNWLRWAVWLERWKTLLWASDVFAARVSHPSGKQITKRCDASNVRH